MKNKEIEIDQHDLALYESELSRDCSEASVVGYLRCATICDGSDNQLMVQAQSIRDLCTREFAGGCRILWVTDRGASGNLPYWKPGLEPGEYRTGLTVMTQLIERGLVQHVCVYKRNRVARSPRLYLEIEEDYFEKYGVRLLSATETSLDDPDAYRRFSDLLVAVAQFDQQLGRRSGGRAKTSSKGASQDSLADTSGSQP